MKNYWQKAMLLIMILESLADRFGLKKIDIFLCYPARCTIERYLSENGMAIPEKPVTDVLSNEHAMELLFGEKTGDALYEIFLESRKHDDQLLHVFGSYAFRISGTFQLMRENGMNEEEAYIAFRNHLKSGSLMKRCSPEAFPDAGTVFSEQE